MVFGDLQPGDKFLEYGVIEMFRKERKKLGSPWPWVHVMTKIDLRGTAWVCSERIPRDTKSLQCSSIKRQTLQLR